MKQYLKLLLLGIIGVYCPSALSAEKVLTYAVKAGPDSLDVMSRFNVPTYSFGMNIYESLVALDTDLKPVASLATEWENISPTIWRFSLRKNVKFHDETPFTSHDVVFSLERARQKGSDIMGALTSVKEILLIDEYTIDVVTLDKNPLLPVEIVALPIFSKSWCEAHHAMTPFDVSNKEEVFSHRHTNGTGPFRLVSFTPEVEIIIEKNPNWWGSRFGNIDRMIIKPMASDATRVAGLIAKEVELMSPLSIQDIERVKYNPGLQVIEAPDILTLYLGMNQADEKLSSCDLDKNPFKDQRVREAIAHAIDIQAIHTKIMRGYSVPSGLMVAESVRGFQKDLNKIPEYNLEKSKKLMADAGYANGFSVTLDCTNDRYIKDESIAQAIAQMVAKIGIKVNLLAQPKAQFSGKILNYKSDFFLHGWMPSTIDAHDALFNLVATRKAGGQGKFNIGGYSNPILDDKIALIHKEMDVSKRNELMYEALKIVKDDCALIPLHQQKLVYGASKVLKGFQLRPDDIQNFSLIKSE